MVCKKKNPVQEKTPFVQVKIKSSQVKCLSFFPPPLTPGNDEFVRFPKNAGFPKRKIWGKGGTKKNEEVTVMILEKPRKKRYMFDATTTTDVFNPRFFVDQVMLFIRCKKWSAYQQIGNRTRGPCAMA